MLVTYELRHYVQDSQAELVLVGQDLYPQMVPLLREGTVRRAVVVAYSDYRGDQPGVPMPDVVAAAREVIAEPGVTLWVDAMAAGGEPGPLRVGPGDLGVVGERWGGQGRREGG